QPLARPLKHLDDGAGGLVDGNAIPPRFPRCESEHLVRCTDRALTDSCPAMRGARAPRSRSWDRRRGIHTTEHELKLPKLEENMLNPVPQFVIQRSEATSGRCPPEFAERKNSLVDQRPQGEAEERNLERRRRSARTSSDVAIRDRARVRAHAYGQQ